jgi:diaminopimelate epimerase
VHIEFYKYQSTGNDFILVDNRATIFPAEDKLFINKLCDRRFGIGADGLILLETSASTNFTMRYFNADGSLGSFCGNGARAVVGFAQYLRVIVESGLFDAYDGHHEAKIIGDLIQIKMADVQNGSKMLNGTFIDTGSPHYVEFVENLDQMDVLQQGRKTRNLEIFAPNGSNINYVEKIEARTIKVRTYERGVENETLSCGTGVTAAAIAASMEGMGSKISINTLGGDLNVWFEEHDNVYHDIWLQGPTEMVYSGEIEV